MKERRGGIEALSVLLFGLLPIGVLFTAYVVLYVQSRNESLTQRNFRALATMGRNLAGRLEGINEAVENNRKGDGKAGAGESPNSSEDLDWIKAIPNLDSGPCRGNPDSSIVWRLADGRSTSRLFLGCRSVQVEKILRPQVPPTLFDDLLVVQAGTSKVVYHWHSFNMGDMPNLATLLDDSEDGKATKAKSDKKDGSDSDKQDDKAGAPRKGGDPDVASMKETSFAFSKPREVSYFGEKYLVYAVPLALGFKFADGSTNAAAGSASEHVVLFGLVRQARFMAEARELSLSLLLALALILLLALFTWPLLKLWFLGARERLDALNVYILGIAMIASLGLFTAGILDLVLYRGMIARFDEDLTRLSGEMGARLQGQILSAAETLREAVDSVTKGSLSTDIRYDDSIDQIFLMDRYGDPLSTWKPSGDGAAKTRSGQEALLPWLQEAAVPKRLNVADRGYFQDARDGKFWGLGAAPFAAEVVQSRLDGKTTLVLAAPAPFEKQLLVSLRPSSVLGARLPPGYSFAIVDRYGKVMLHSDDRRILQENLFLETGGGGPLKSAVVTRLEQHFDGDYYGQAHRFVTFPWKGSPWSLVLMYQKDPMRRVNTAMVATWSIMFTIYLVGFVAAAVVCQFLWPGYRAEWIWPRRDLTRSYFVGAFLCLTTLVCCFVIFEPVDAASQLVRTTGGPVLALLALYVVLTPRSQGRWVAAFVFLWLGAAVISARAAELDWSAAAPLLVPLATVALLPLCKPSLPNNERRFRFAYTLMLFALLAVTAPAPSAVLFDDSLDEATLSFMRWNERESLRAMPPCKEKQTEPCEPSQRGGFYADLFQDVAAKRTPASPDDSLAVRISRWLDTRKLRSHLASRFFPSIPVRSDAIPGYNQMVVNAAADESWLWTSDGERGGTMKIDEAGDMSLAPAKVDARAPSFFSAAGWECWVMVIVAILILAVGTFFVLGSIVRRLFLLDADGDGGVHLPVRQAGLRGLYLLWRPLRTLLSPDQGLDANTVVYDLTRQTPAECGRAVDQLDPHANHVVILDHFETRMDDAKATRGKLDLLGKLDKRDEIAVVLVSDLEPLSYCQSVADGAENGTNSAAADVSRWADALRNYYTSCVLPAEPAAAGAGGLLGGALADVLGRRTREQEEESRNEGRHRRLWNQLSRPEKLALLQLADEGFLNPKVPEVARALMQRGLIRRDPAFRIMDRGFPEFVRGAESSATVRAWENEGARSSWAKLRPALILLLIFGIGFLYSTQRGLFSETVAFATAIAGAVPLLLRLFANFGRQPDGASSDR